MPFWQSSALDRNTPRTCTPENANTATSGDNEVTYVADLAIDPVTRQVDFSHSVPIESIITDTPQLREKMKLLLDIIMGFFEAEMQKVESGELKKEEQLLSPMYKKSTQVPNVLLDHYLKDLSAAELMILLTVIRQTNGWVKRGSNARKTRDRISHSQFMTKTGLSRRIISQAISSLLNQGLISVSDQFGNQLSSGKERSGRSYLFYTSTCAFNDTNRCTFEQKPVQKVIHNKTNYTKLNMTKLREGSGLQSVADVIAKMTTYDNGRVLIKNYRCRDMIE